MAIIEKPMLLDVPEELVTERMLLRIPRPGDSRFTWPAIVESQAELAPWMPWAYPQASEPSAEEFCRRAAANFLMRQQFHYLLFLRGADTCLGTCGTPRLNWSVPSFDPCASSALPSPGHQETSPSSGSRQPGGAAPASAGPCGARLRNTISRSARPIGGSSGG